MDNSQSLSKKLVTKWQQEKDPLRKIAMEKLIDNLNHKTMAKVSRPYFANHYFGLTVPEHQYEWYETFGGHKQKYPANLLLSPRDHGKTTILPRIIVEHFILYNPGVNVLLLSKTATQAQKSLKVIRNDFEKNKLIKHDFSDELKDFKATNTYLNCNKGEQVSRDATVEANGLLGNITGSHFDMIVMDDVFDDENTRTPEARRNAMKWINGTIIPLLEPDTILLAIGTRKHYDDGYAEMIKSQGWYVKEERAILKWPDKFEFIRDKNGVATDVTIEGDYEVLWPEKWSLEKLLLQKYAIQGSIMFEREYQNNAEGLKGTNLKEHWLRFYALHPNNATRETPKRPSVKQMDIYIGIDLAISESKRADYFCATVIGTVKEPEFRIYVLDWVHDRIPFPEQVKVVKSLYSKWKKQGQSILFGIESNNYQMALPQMVIKDKPMPVKPVPAMKNKIKRILSRSTNYENGLVYLPVDHDKYQEFLMEYVSFGPDAPHDDYVDSLDIAMGLIDEDEEEFVEPIVASVPIW